MGQLGALLGLLGLQAQSQRTQGLLYHEIAMGWSWAIRFVGFSLARSGSKQYLCQLLTHGTPFWNVAQGEFWMLPTEILQVLALQSSER